MGEDARQGEHNAGQREGQPQERTTRGHERQRNSEGKERQRRGGGRKRRRETAKEEETSNDGRDKQSFRLRNSEGGANREGVRQVGVCARQHLPVYSPSPGLLSVEVIENFSSLSAAARATLREAHSSHPSPTHSWPPETGIPIVRLSGSVCVRL